MLTWSIDLEAHFPQTKLPKGSLTDRNFVCDFKDDIEMFNEILALSMNFIDFLQYFRVVESLIKIPFNTNYCSRISSWSSSNQCKTTLGDNEFISRAT